MASRLTLICHGSTDAVRAAAFPGDEPLDRHGRADAAALAGRLPSAARCWTSPELRTRQTAEALQLDAVPLAEFRDCDYGAWKGQTLEAVLAREPNAVAAWLSDPAAAPHGGESLMALTERVARWLAGENATHRHAIVVTHATIIRAAIVCAMEAPPRSFWRIDIAPLSLTQLSGKDGRWTVVSSGCAR